MKLFAVWNPKGGQGKSVISLNLAAAAYYELGLTPVIIDYDEQGTCYTYFQDGGKIPFQVTISQRRPQKADLVIIDTAGSDWEHIPPCQTIIVPTFPDRTCLSVTMRAIAMIQDKGKQVIRVVTNANPHSIDEQATVLKLKRSGSFEIKRSGAFSKAAKTYRTLFDPALKRSYEIKKRQEEFISILTAALGQVENEKERPPEERVANG